MGDTRSAWGFAHAEDAADFGGGGSAVLDGLEGAVPSGGHAGADRDGFESADVGAVENGPADVLAVGQEEFGEHDPAGVSRAPTGFAALGKASLADVETEAVLGRVGGDRAGGAEPSDEALGDHGAEAAADGVGLDPHVEESADDLAGAAGVEGGERQVAGQRGLERDLGGASVADLADGDHLGILPEQRGGRPQESGRKPG